MRKSELTERIRGGDCTVLGYGVSNRPLVTWLMAHGARSVTVREKRPPDVMEKDGDAERIRAAGASLICGDGYLDGLGGDLIFRSPGFRPDLPEIRAAVAGGAVLTSEMELFLALTEATVVGISGSDGKTTTTTLTARILEAVCRRTGKGRVYLGGNIGTPLLPLVEEMTADDFAVVELSSFQLMTMGTGASVACGVLTNISPNHLNWHTDMEEYVRAKGNLLGGAKPPRTAVLNARNAYTRAIGAELTCPVVWFSGETGLPQGWLPDTANLARGDGAVYERDGMIVCVRKAAHGTLRTVADGEPRIPADGLVEIPLLEVSRIRLPGRHNVENYMAAIGATCCASWIEGDADGDMPAGRMPASDAPAFATPPDVGEVADTFTGVPHRLELVREKDGVRYYNGSIDSSPTRTVAALNAIREMNGRAGRPAPIVICGGQDKHVPFDPLASALCRMASAVVLTGEAREQIMDALRACPDFDPEKLPVTVIPDYRTAMRQACLLAKEGDTVLLSPACTSFDAFRNFEERGEVFREIVLGL